MILVRARAIAVILVVVTTMLFGCNRSGFTDRMNNAERLLDSGFASGAMEVHRELSKHTDLLPEQALELDLLMGRILLAQRVYGTALDNLAKASQNDRATESFKSKAAIPMAEALFYQGQGDRAVTVLEDAFEAAKAPELRSQILLALARLKTKLHDLPAAIDIYENRLPGQIIDERIAVPAFFELAEVLYLSGHIERADALLGDAERRFAREKIAAEAMAKKIAYHSRMGRIDQALKLFEKLGSSWPSQTECLASAGLAIGRAMIRDEKLAAQGWDRIRAIAQIGAQSDAAFSALMTLFESAIRGEDFSTAEKHADQIRDNYCERPIQCNQGVFARLWLAVVRGDLKAAERHLDALQGKPIPDDVYLRILIIASMYFPDRDDLEKSVDRIDLLAKASPGDPWVDWFKAVRSGPVAGPQPESSQSFDPIFRNKVRMDAVNAFCADGEFGAARRQVDSLGKSLDPQSRLARRLALDWGECMKKAGNPDEAVTSLVRAAQSDQRRIAARAWLSLAALYAQCGRNDLSKKAFDRAIPLLDKAEIERQRLILRQKAICPDVLVAPDNSLCPETAEASKLMGKAHFKAAAKNLASYISENPEPVCKMRALAMLERIYEEQGRKKLAEKIGAIRNGVCENPEPIADFEQFLSVEP